MTEDNFEQMNKDLNQPQDSAEINLDNLEQTAPPDPFFPGSGPEDPNNFQAMQEQLPSPSEGANAYVEASADGGQIDLGQFDLPPENSSNAPDASFTANSKTAPETEGRQLGGAAMDNFSLSAPGGQDSATLSTPGADQISAPSDHFKKDQVIHWLTAPFSWLAQLWRMIPPLEDIFDNILAGLGFQRKPASMLKRANNLAAKGRLGEAIGWYRTLLSLKPLMVPAYDGLGRAYFRMGLTEEADREFTVADCLERLLHNRDDIEAAAHLAQAMLEKRQAKMAVSLVEPILVAHFYTPHNSILLKAMGKVYGELRSNKKLFQVYSAGLAQYPNDYEFYLLKGDIDLKIGNISEGENLIRWGRAMKNVKECPNDPQAKITLGELHIKEKNIDDGIKLLKEAAALMPDNSGVRWRLFNLYQKKGNFEASLKYFLAIVKIEPDNEELKYSLAEFYRRNQRSEPALKIYRELADKNSRDPKPHALLGELLIETGHLDEGQTMRNLAATLECGLKAKPDHKDTVCFMNYLFSINANEEAIKWLERGLMQWPYHGELVLTKVKLLYAEYRYKEAMVLLKRLIAIKNDVAEPHIWIAMCYQRLGDNMAALAEAQLATRLAPKSVTAHKVLGDVLKEQKKLSQANAAYEVAEMIRQAGEK